MAQLRRCLDHDDAVAGAICADGHLGYSQPVGGVGAYREHLSVSGVDFDIACGNLAVRTDMPFSEELGTVGAGNHYVDLFREVKESVDEAASLAWIGIHFGSRGLGHRLATQYLKHDGGREGIDVKPALLHQDSDLGWGCLVAMELAGRYAYAGREWVAGAPAWVQRLHPDLPEPARLRGRARGLRSVQRLMARAVARVRRFRSPPRRSATSRPRDSDSLDTAAEGVATSGGASSRGLGRQPGVVGGLGVCGGGHMVSRLAFINFHRHTVNGRFIGSGPHEGDAHHRRGRGAGIVRNRKPGGRATR